MSKELLSIRNLKTYFYTEEGVVPAVDDVSLSLCEGETIGIVGESGCGKSVMALSVMQLLQSPPAKIVQGEIILEGQNLLGLSKSEMREIRGKKISMIFQEPMTSLNPVITIGRQISESAILHLNKNKVEAKEMAIEMLDMVGIPSARSRYNDYPHQMSGGMRQRVMIAIALICNPKLLIADEPTTALDVTIQAQILDLIIGLKKRLGMAVMFITHDLGVVSETADKISVIYAGKVVETGTVASVFEAPKHPYTLGLMKSVPRLKENVARLNTIPGFVPSPWNFPTGCRFHPRCNMATERCRTEIPTLSGQKDHQVACWLF